MKTISTPKRAKDEKILNIWIKQSAIDEKHKKHDLERSLFRTGEIEKSLIFNHEPTRDNFCAWFEADKDLNAPGDIIPDNPHCVAEWGPPMENFCVMCHNGTRYFIFELSWLPMVTHLDIRFPGGRKSALVNADKAALTGKPSLTPIRMTSGKAGIKDVVSAIPPDYYPGFRFFVVYMTPPYAGDNIKVGVVAAEPTSGRLGTLGIPNFYENNCVCFGLNNKPGSSFKFKTLIRHMVAFWGSSYNDHLMPPNHSPWKKNLIKTVIHMPGEFRMGRCKNASESAFYPCGSQFTTAVGMSLGSDPGLRGGAAMWDDHPLGEAMGYIRPERDDDEFDPGPEEEVLVLDTATAPVAPTVTIDMNTIPAGGNTVTATNL